MGHFTNTPDLQPPLGQDEVNEGPIPEGIWWLKRDNLQCIDDLGFWRGTFGGTWPGGVKRWGRYRLWLEHDPETKNQGRTNLCVLGNESRNTGGNIHIFDSETDFTDMEVFKKNFVKRVEIGGRLKMRVNYAKSYKKGDTGKIVEEINIRLAGFGGGVPSDVFDDLTETKVKNFEKLYMKRGNPKGIVDMAVAEAIDEFGEEYVIDEDMFRQLKCKCESRSDISVKCAGFGNGKFKNEFSQASTAEAFHRYEYPGIHRSLLWAIRGLDYHLWQEDEKIERFGFSSGYRCYGSTVNHRGKAVDIIYRNQINGQWINRDQQSSADRQIVAEQVRTICQKSEVLNATIDWIMPASKDRFSLESVEMGATTWVHVDVREFDRSKYLDDRFFCKNLTEINGEKLILLLQKEV
ncbi:peptidoglycan-binding domain-containing protein [Chitinispirillales bacterium ANBcel5]|uniref:peptidoglycan-binding domain-containing protein n=1 Tax=Cellulosispirillum alkaliphilum TaxID=3039283 RepID=UPI002A51CDBF|nr:peptidoglycan-binding domain-containing protein [Chitinispirillales bacterium ANBcel5]